MAQYEWRNTMRKIDHLMTSPLNTRVICTDFGATLDLNAAELDNCSVAHHAVVDIFFVNMNWRSVKFKNKNDVEDEAIVSDCEKWIFFGDTISRGKKKRSYFS